MSLANLRQYEGGALSQMRGAGLYPEASLQAGDRKVLSSAQCWERDGAHASTGSPWGLPA